MSSLRPLRLIAALMALLLAAGACSSDPPAVIVSGADPTTAAKDIPQTLEAEGFTILSALLAETGLDEVLAGGDGDQTFTVFAPTDAAFEALGGAGRVFAGEEDVIVMPDEDSSDGEEATGDELESDEEAADEESTDESSTDQGAEATGEDEEATGDVSDATEPVEPLSSGEISALLEEILLYHVVDGTVLSGDFESTSRLTSLEGSALVMDSREEEPTTEGADPTIVYTVDGADVSDTDLLATNGVIHAIDEVLVPPDRAEDLQRLIASIPVATDVVSTLERTGEHTQLVAAIDEAGLTDDLRDAPAVTIFAPTDAAFDRLSASQQEALSDPDVLMSVLTFHVVGRTITEADVPNRESVTTLEGGTVLFAKDGDVYTVNGVEIDDEIPATNGVVLVIGDILVPTSAQGPGGL